MTTADTAAAGEMPMPVKPAIAAASNRPTPPGVAVAAAKLANPESTGASGVRAVRSDWDR